LQKYKQRDKRIRPFRSSERLGVTKALNMGIMYSRSELVARMDSDDVSMPERFEIQVKFLDAHPDIWVVGSRFWSMDETLTKVNWNNDVPTDPDDIREQLLSSCCIGHPTVMMRRRLVENIGGYDEREVYQTVEDYELWKRASKRYKIANVPQYMLKHREHAGQVTNKLRQIQIKNLKALVESKENRLQETE
jgi:glycosyltransferase involved in cell wall biosynthesis